VIRERELRKDALRNRIRILVTAEALIRTRGWAVRTEDVARLAGVGIGTLFRHFATKDALMEAVLAGRLEQLTNDAVDSAKRSDAGKALGEIFTRLVLEHPDDVTLAASLNHSPLREALDTLLRRAQRGGTIRKDVDVDGLSSLAVGAVMAGRQIGDEAGKALTLAVIRDGLRVPHVRQVKRLGRR
jgi:AcrR family transcriptional regulator